MASVLLDGRLCSRAVTVAGFCRASLNPKKAAERLADLFLVFVATMMCTRASTPSARAPSGLARVHPAYEMAANLSHSSAAIENQQLRPKAPNRGH